MNNKKKKKPNHKPLIIIVVIIIAIISIFLILSNHQTKVEETIPYYTGDIYSANYAANILDELNGDNKLISPLNLNLYYLSLYNISSKEEEKEFNDYFENNLKETNKLFESKLKNLEETKIKKTKHNLLYEEYIKKYIDKGYNTLTIDNIKRMSNKDDLIKLLVRIKLSYEGKMPVKDIKKYNITREEKKYNAYQIKELIDTINTNYETYSNKNIINNLNQFYYTKDYELKKDTTEKLSSTLNIKFIKSDNIEESINKSLKENSNNRIKKLNNKISRPKSMLSLNSMYMNYKWDSPFKEFKNQEFLNLDKSISIVEIMYGEEKIYYENDHALAFKKDFENKKYSFYAILPKQKGDFTLSSLDIDNLLKEERSSLVKIGMPSFNFQYEYDISKLDNNLYKVYDQNTKLSKLSEDKIYISNSVQKLYLNIGYKGTIISEYRRELTQEIEESRKDIILTRPFAFLIKSNETNDIIFIGKITII